MDCGKAALLFGALAFQLHMLSIAFDGYYLVGRIGTDLSDRDDAVKAFLIIAFLCFLAAQVLLLLMNFGDFRGNKLVGILVILILILAGTLKMMGQAVVQIFWPSKHKSFEFRVGYVETCKNGSSWLSPFWSFVKNFCSEKEARKHAATYCTVPAHASRDRVDTSQRKLLD